MSKKKQTKRIISIISIIFFILAFLLLIFAMVSSNNSDLSLFGYRFYYVSTDSMEPDLKVGTFIIVNEIDPNELKVGDVISFVSSDPDIKGMVNTHAVYAKSTDDSGNLEFTTKGVNAPKPDEYKVYPKDIKGKLAFSSYTIGQILNFLSKRWVSFCITIIPLAIIVLINLVDIIVLIYKPQVKTEPEDNSEKSDN